MLIKTKITDKCPSRAAPRAWKTLILKSLKSFFFFFVARSRDPIVRIAFKVHHNCIRYSSPRFPLRESPSKVTSSLTTWFLISKESNRTASVFVDISPPSDRAFMHPQSLNSVSKIDGWHVVVATSIRSVNTNARDEAEFPINNISSTQIIPPRIDLSPPNSSLSSLSAIIRVQTPSIVSMMRSIESDGIEDWRWRNK